MGAELASAIINEVETAFGKEAVDRLPSGQLLREMDRGGKTGHAAAVTRKVMESNPSIGTTSCYNCGCWFDEAAPGHLPQ